VPEKTESIGRFGPYGGQFVPETLMPCLRELEDAYSAARADESFNTSLWRLQADYSGRPTPLYRAESLGRVWGETGPGNANQGNPVTVYLKREDLNHTGAHKINNCLGQVLLAERMGKRRIIAETGAGQHGVATAAVAARFQMECTIYMGEVDIVRQQPNVVRMELMGARVVPVASGSRTLKDATNEAIRDWVTNVTTSHYIIGSTVGPHPYPAMVRDFQAVIGNETREQILSVEGRLPSDVIACVGGGSNAIGMYAAFLDDPAVRLHGVEAGGSELGHAAALCLGEPGVLHGSLSYLLQDDDGQVQLPHSIAAGLDYPGVGPQHSQLRDSGRVRYGQVGDEEALTAFAELSRLEGIIPALESSHALAYTKQLLAGLTAPATGASTAGNSKADTSPDLIVINLSGRGDKDMQSVQDEPGIHA